VKFHFKGNTTTQDN